MKEPERPGAKILRAAKQHELKLKAKKKLKEKEMKNSTTKTIVASVVVTLAVALSYVGVFLAGINYSESLNDRIKAEAKVLSQTVAPSKQ